MPPSQRTIYAESLATGDVYTWANGVTALRLVIGLLIFAWAAIEQSAAWNTFGLLSHWGFDTLDGYLARRLQQETRFGAQIDILADRLLMVFFYFNLLTAHPELRLVVVLFLVEFLFLDHFLSNQFLRWPIRSPNYFYLVDRALWRLNWSPLAKFLNSGLVPLLLLVTPTVMPVLAVLLGVLGVKLYSCVRLRQIPLPAEAAELS